MEQERNDIRGFHLDERVYIAHWEAAGSTYVQPIAVDPDEHPNVIIGLHGEWVWDTFGVVATYRPLISSEAATPRRGI